MGLRRSYLAFNAALDSLYADDLLSLADSEDYPTFDDSAFLDAAGMVYRAGGFDVSQLATPQARRLIAETLRHLNRAISSALPHEVPESVRHALENNAFIFSGFKTYHSLREVGLSLTTDSGDIKPFADFHKDVLKLNNQYNHNYLYAEYNHAIGASVMAARWQQFEADGDRYDLQYRTAQDDRVRDDHAILHGTTLPPSDPFWSLYLPPNGWNCRCTAVQVRKGKFPLSDPALSMLRGNNCTENAKQQIFRFNPGHSLQLFPPKHPYFPKGCGDCEKRLNLDYKPESEKCRACQAIKLICALERNKPLYERFKKDPNYSEVTFNEETGGLVAVHQQHNFDPKGGIYERHVINAALKGGYAVVLEAEPGVEFNKRYTEGTWDGIPFEVAGRETGTASNIKRGLEHCADKPEAYVAVLDFPNGGFSMDNFNLALRRFKGLEKLNDRQFRKFKKIICIQNEQIIHVEYM